MLELLEPRIAIVLAKDKYTFQNTLNEFQVKLKQYFQYDYTLDEIETALNNLECNHLDNIHKNEQEALVTKTHEDYEILTITTLV